MALLIKMEEMRRATSKMSQLLMPCILISPLICAVTYSGNSGAVGLVLPLHNLMRVSSMDQN